MIYIVINYSPRSADGISQAVQRIIDSFDSEQKAQLRLLCNDTQELDTFTFNDVKVINFKTKPRFVLDVLFSWSRLQYSFSIYKFLQKNIADEDVVNIHDGAGIAFFPSVFKKYIKKKFTLIVTIHGSTCDLYFQLIKRLPYKFILIKILLPFLLCYLWIMEFLMSRNVDHFIFISMRTRNLYHKLYNITQSSSHITNGLFSTHKSLESHEDGDVVHALIVGSRTYTKGLDIAIKAIQEVNRRGNYTIKITVIGFFDFQKYYKESPPCVKYINYVESQDMTYWYSCADFLLFPSRWEEFVSLVVLESMENGLPFIVSKASRVGEILNGHRYGMQLQTYTIDAWADAIESMAQQETRDKFQKNIIQANLEQYDWKNISIKYQELLFK